MTLRLSICAVAAFLFVGSEGAHACGLIVPPYLRIQGEFDAIVVVTVTEAGSTDPGRPGRRPWQATGEVRRTVTGQADAQVYRFGRTSRDVCETAWALPHLGDEWVLYLSRADVGLSVRASYPLAVATRHDPRLRASADPQPM